MVVFIGCMGSIRVLPKIECVSVEWTAGGNSSNNIL
jgi:hypothetical protein